MVRAKRLCPKDSKKKYYIEAFVRLSNRFFQKTPIHKEWLPLLRQFSKHLNWCTSKDDLSFWYGERALSGFLAASAWALPNGWSLEEFTGLRVNGSKQSAGKGDIWIGIGKKTFTVEAKIIWGCSDGLAAKIRAELRKAGDQLDKLDPTYQDGIPTAVCYVVPELTATSSYATNGHLDFLLETIPAELATSKRVVASFTFNRKSVPCYNGKLYPGIIVVAEFRAPWIRKETITPVWKTIDFRRNKELGHHEHFSQ
jgi:hypothetical protein